MTRRTGLSRHGLRDEGSGDPLDGLVNLFDIGIVLALAFLIAGLGLTLDRGAHRLRPRSSTTPSQQRAKPLPSPSAGAPLARGHGQPVGTVYRLADGQLIYVQK